MELHAFSARCNVAMASDFEPRAHTLSAQGKGRDWMNYPEDCGGFG